LALWPELGKNQINIKVKRVVAIEKRRAQIREGRNNILPLHIWNLHCNLALVMEVDLE
jgi:hypothetical protein